jgi:hypothetical protein
MATVRREGGANGVFEVPNASTDMNDDARLTGRTRLFAFQWTTIALIKRNWRRMSLRAVMLPRRQARSTVVQSLGHAYPSIYVPPG